jgi:hypothetical protein
MSYTPELGQACFGQPWKEYECPQILEAALMFLSEELQRVTWNLRQAEWHPFSNRGEAFRCDTFGVWSYDWSDPEDRRQPYNFCHLKSGLCVSWYKYLGRGMACNRIVDPAEVAEILKDCIDALEKVEAEPGAPYQLGGMGAVPYFETPR